MSVIGKFLHKVTGSFSTDMAIDLGTSNTRVYVKGKGIVLNEPTIVAVNQKTGQLVAVGTEAETMLGRTPAHIAVIKPLVDGVISDYETTEEMLLYLINRVRDETKSLIAPRILICVPSGITNVEHRAARDAAKNAGAKDVFLIEAPLAAALGAKLPIGKAGGSMIIDIGGGTTDVAVISLNGIVVSRNLRVAGEHLTHSIMSYVRDQFKLHIGDKTAENIKIKLATLTEKDQNEQLVVRGRDVITGLPHEVAVTESDVQTAIASKIDNVVETIRLVLEETPPEVMADIMQNGIHLSGGGAMIPGLKQILESVLEVPVIIVPDPSRATIRGAGIVIENLSNYEEILIEKDKNLFAKFLD